MTVVSRLSDRRCKEDSMSGESIAVTAAVLERERVCVMETQDVEVNLQPSQVLVRSRVSLISTGTEMSMYLGTHSGIANPDNTWTKYPFRPGYATVGVIERIGDAVTRWQVGDRVFIRTQHASHNVCAEDAPIAIPDDVSDEHAPFARLGSISLCGVRAARLHLGDPVVVIGQGLIGLLALRGALLDGGRPAIGVDIDEDRLALARELGATATINPATDDVGEAVKRLTGGRMAAAVIEATGKSTTVPGALDLLTDGGVLVLLGGVHGKVSLDLYDTIHRRGLRMVGAHENNVPPVPSQDNHWTYRNNFALMLDLIARGELPVEPLITDRSRAEKLPALYEAAASEPRNHLGMLVEWGE
ncbi:MAG: zinc-binding dehydrogenase [Chitinivibrionales bacterium]|nr:zinc-binding dehydrogenase [Chitinivibrionales bacterium]